MIQFNKSIKNNCLISREVCKQGHFWLISSLLLYGIIIILVFKWDLILLYFATPLWWVIVSIILVIFINWWYWTMTIILNLVAYQQQEVEIINELLTDIKKLKIAITYLQDNDKSD